MKKWLSQRMYVFYFCVIFLYVLNNFLDSYMINYIVGLIAIPILAISFLLAKRLFQVLGGIFVGTGTAMYINAGLPLAEVPLFLTSNMNLIAFLSVLPWINCAAHVGRYEQHIINSMKGNVNHLGKLYPRSIITSGILLTFLNLSAINLSQTILLKSMKDMNKKIRDRFIARSTIRAYSLTMIWSPMEIMVGIVVDATGVSYLIYLPWLLFISLVVLLVDIQVQKRSFRSEFYQSDQLNLFHRTRKRTYIPILKLFMVFGCFLLVVILTNQVFHFNFILAVTLVIFPFSFVWSLTMNKTSRFLMVGYASWKNQTNNMQNFFVLFISLALFSNSLNETNLLQWIQQPFLSHQGFPLVILVLILFTYIGMGMFGVHPVATVAILLEVLRPFFEIYNPLGLGIMLIIGALATASSSTYGVVVTMTALNTVQNPYRITATNLGFTLMFGAVGITIAYLLV